MTKSKIFGALLCICFASSTLFSQENSSGQYQLDWKKEVAIMGAGASLSLTGFLIEQRLEDRTALEIEGIKSQNVLGIDARATKNNSHAAQKASDWVLRGAAVLPLTLLADEDIRQDAGKIAVLGSETFLLTYGLTNLAKVVVRRDRPFVFNEGVPVERKLSVDSQLSFFSGHTSATSAATFFTAKIWTDYHPDSKWKPAVWTAAAIIPAATGYLRVKAGKHCTSDVVTGYAVGALVGYFVPQLHKIKRGEKRKLRMSTTMVGEAPVFNLKYRF